MYFPGNPGDYLSHNSYPQSHWRNIRRTASSQRLDPCKVVQIDPCIHIALSLAFQKLHSFVTMPVVWLSITIKELSGGNSCDSTSSVYKPRGLSVETKPAAPTAIFWMLVIGASVDRALSIDMTPLWKKPWEKVRKYNRLRGLVYLKDPVIFNY